MKLGRGMLQEERQGIMYFRMGYPVIIIQEQIDFVFAVGQLVDQRGNDRIYRHQEEEFGDLADGRFADAVAGAPQRMGYVEKKSGRLVVVEVESKPGQGAAFTVRLPPFDVSRERAQKAAPAEALEVGGQGLGIVR